jgi:hypothetical protein
VKTWWDAQIAPGIPASSPEAEALSPSPSPSYDEEVVAPSPVRVPSAAAPNTLTGDLGRLQKKRQLKDAEAPHVMKASSDND